MLHDCSLYASSGQKNSTKSGSEVFEYEECCLGFSVSIVFGNLFKTALVKWCLFSINQHLSILKPKTQDPRPKTKDPRPKHPITQEPNNPITQNQRPKTQDPIT